MPIYGTWSTQEWTNSQWSENANTLQGGAEITPPVTFERLTAAYLSVYQDGFTEVDVSYPLELSMPDVY